MNKSEIPKKYQKYSEGIKKEFKKCEKIKCCLNNKEFAKKIGLTKKDVEICAEIFAYDHTEYTIYKNGHIICK